MSTVLLVEDDVWLQEMYADELTDVEILRAHSAEEALAQLDIHAVDLLVLDMFLADHNGVEFMHEMASYQDTADIPIIILSAVAPHDFALSPQRMKHYNIVEYLYKPEVKPREVAERIHFHLRQFVANL